MNKQKEFVFPMNYKEKEKFLGIVEYKVVFVISIFWMVVFFFIRNIKIELLPKVVLFITICGFFTVLILVGVNGENMVDFIYFMMKFFMREKVYVYRKTEEKEKIFKCLNRLDHGSQ